MTVFITAGMDEGYIKFLFADKGWGGVYPLSGYYTHRLIFFLQLIPDFMESALLQARLVDESASEYIPLINN